MFSYTQATIDSVAATIETIDDTAFKVQSLTTEIIKLKTSDSNNSTLIPMEMKIQSSIDRGIEEKLATI